MRKFLRILGPGLLYAGAAIGVSHLVQSTRAGAMFNFDLSYTIGVTNSFRDRTRTNSHMVMLNVGVLF